MKDPKHYIPWILLILAGLLLVAACNDANAPASPSSVEIEVDQHHHYPSHAKTTKPRVPKAPAYRAPSKTRRR